MLEVILCVSLAPMPQPMQPGPCPCTPPQPFVAPCQAFEHVFHQLQPLYPHPPPVASARTAAKGMMWMVDRAAVACTHTAHCLR